MLSDDALRAAIMELLRDDGDARDFVQLCVDEPEYLEHGRLGRVLNNPQPKRSSGLQHCEEIASETRKLKSLSILRRQPSSALTKEAAE